MSDTESNEDVGIVEVPYIHNKKKKNYGEAEGLDIHLMIHR